MCQRMHAPCQLTPPPSSPHPQDRVAELTQQNKDLITQTSQLAATRASLEEEKVTRAAAEQDLERTRRRLDALAKDMASQRAQHREFVEECKQVAERSHQERT